MSETPSGVLKILKSMVLYSQISGAYPHHEPFKSTISFKLCLVYHLILAIAHNTASVQYIANITFNLRGPNQNIVDILSKLAPVTMSLAADINTFMILRRRHLLNQIFRRLQGVDLHLQTLGGRMKYFRFWIFCLMACCPFVASIVTLLIMSRMAVWSYGIFLVIVCSNAIATVQMPSGLLAIAAEQLQQIRTQVSNSYPTFFGIVPLSELQGRTVTTCHLISTVFANQMMATLMTSFFFIVINTFYFLQPFSMAYTVVAVRTFWTSAYLFLGYTVVNALATVRKEVKEFNILLYQLMINDKSNKISRNKKLRLHIAMKREVVFTAYGFFNLDYTLVHSMLAAATTYLVILLQFNQSPPSLGVITIATHTPINSTILPTLLTTL